MPIYGWEPMKNRSTIQPRPAKPGLLAAILCFTAVLSCAGQEAPSVRPLPRGYRTVTLGMRVEEVKRALLDDPYYRYRGDPDVSLVPGENRTLIECEGSSFISRAFFQFHEDRLYAITLLLDPTKIDYYSMYRHLTAAYGEETSLGPNDAIWESPETRICLERPVGVKYIDLPVFEKLVETGRALRAREEVLRDAFIGDF